MKQGKLLLLNILIIFVVTPGCTTLNLNDKILDRPVTPDPIIFPDPICVNAEFKWDDFGRISVMSRTQISQLTAGFLYYNIFLNCTHPAGDFKIIYHSSNQSSAIDKVWRTSFYLTLGIIPYYSYQRGYFTIEENGVILSRMNYQIKQIGSAFIFPLAIIDDMLSIHKFQTNSDRALKSRFLAIAIKSALADKKTRSTTP